MAPHGAHRARRQPQADETVALSPPQTLVLQVGELALLGLPVGVGDLVCDVGALTGEDALTSHDSALKILGEGGNGPATRRD